MTYKVLNDDYLSPVCLGPSIYLSVTLFVWHTLE
jgi:hypothetical protein